MVFIQSKCFFFQAKVVLFGHGGGTRAKMVVFGQSGCVQSKWLCS